MIQKPAVGAAVQRVFEERGVETTIEEAREFAVGMIDLICRGLIVPVDEVVSRI